jgi:hypothetical protein
VNIFAFCKNLFVLKKNFIVTYLSKRCCDVLCMCVWFVALISFKSGGLYVSCPCVWVAAFLSFFKHNRVRARALVWCPRVWFATFRSLEEKKLCLRLFFAVSTFFKIEFASAPRRRTVHTQAAGAPHAGHGGGHQHEEWGTRLNKGLHPAVASGAGANVSAAASILVNRACFHARARAHRWRMRACLEIRIYV